MGNVFDQGRESRDLEEVKHVHSVMQKTSLSRETVEELLYAGWTYSEELGMPKRWIGPEAQLRR